MSAFDWIDHEHRGGRQGAGAQALEDLVRSGRVIKVAVRQRHVTLEGSVEWHFQREQVLAAVRQLNSRTRALSAPGA